MILTFSLLQAPTLPSESTMKHKRERTLQENKETLGISTTVGFPISMKPSGYEEAETESDVRMVKWNLDFILFMVVVRVVIHPKNV